MLPYHKLMPLFCFWSSGSGPHVVPSIVLSVWHQTIPVYTASSLPTGLHLPSKPLCCTILPFLISLPSFTVYSFMAHLPNLFLFRAFLNLLLQWWEDFLFCCTVFAYSWDSLLCGLRQFFIWSWQTLIQSLSPRDRLQFSLSHCLLFDTTTFKVSFSSWAGDPQCSFSNPSSCFILPVCKYLCHFWIYVLDWLDGFRLKF